MCVVNRRRQGGGGALCTAWAAERETNYGHPDACLRSLSLSALTRRAAFEIDAREAKNGVEGL